MLREIGASQNQHTVMEYSEMDQRDQISAKLLEIESHVKLCEGLIKESSRIDTPHKSFVEKVQIFVIQLKSFVDTLGVSCSEQIEKINSQFSNLEFITPKSNDIISRDPGE
ncbi:unnamed protein product [Rotaria sp. Silwood2]|nr:unnamed protein product [Rotaria sp. Silwood2]CAF4660591.1 unnamed protein product [Rotaria sp. Silwood2]